ncbi:gliding motility-associated-like protein [Chitinophaga niastensis]|uniref:Gliding motility-associated-like protein n=1 Tax=Chitinophaga niastensis TaxID=536980 RepID=A0A2P8HMR8_CHINA|nr:gliding motility-associated C-terminal domain-containing protein [Chitinophaga niastensis]PSL47509.1 gliding motility-associated-like protein [Chitinophaga niastensis]
MRRSLLILCTVLCCLTHSRLFSQASFTAPDTVCVNTPVPINNTSVGGSSFFWNFCSGGLYNPPQVTNLGNVGGLMSLPVFLVTAKEGGNYYAFFTNNTGNLVRLTFGNNLLNMPTAEDLGTFNGMLSNTTEGLQLVKDVNGWHLIVVGGNDPSTARIVRIDFGASLSNPATGSINWGNIGNLDYPVDLYVTQENNQWYGFTVNYYNNTITRFDFGASFSNPPIATNLGNLGNLNHPTGIFALQEKGNWHIFITNESSSTISRLDLGNSLANTPTGVNLGNPGGALNGPRDLCLIHDCGNIFGLVANGSSNDLARIDFKDGITSVVPGLSGTTLATGGGLNFPHSISTIFREGNSLYAFITNVRNNTLSRLVFSNCNNASLPSSNQQQPPVFSYNQPGKYTINLLMNELLMTESAFCKNVVVLPLPKVDLGADTTICNGVSLALDAGPGFNSYKWSSNATTQKITVNQSGTYAVEVSNGGCTATDAIQVNVTTLVQDPVITDIDCNHSLGKIELNTSGGTQPYHYYLNGTSQGTNNVYDKLPAGSYAWKVQDQSGCELSDALTVKVDKDKMINTSAITTPPTCNGLQDGIIDVQVQKGVPPFEFALKGQPYQTTSTFSNLPSGTYTVYTRNAVCLDSLLLKLIAPSVMDMQITKEDELCSRMDGKVSVTVTGGKPPYNFYWNNILAPSSTFEKLGAGSYDLKIVDVNGCNIGTALTISNLTLPPVRILNNDVTINIGETLQLTAINAPDYLWTPSEGLSCINCANPLAKPLQPTSYIVTTITGKNCIKSDTINIKLSYDQSLYVPNAFTPNNDGRNDVFRAKVKGVATYKLLIFNRWGELLFETNDMATGWDGRFKGQVQPFGTYVYLIKYAYFGKEEQVFQQKGTFMLLN